MAVKTIPKSFYSLKFWDLGEWNIFQDDVTIMKYTDADGVFITGHKHPYKYNIGVGATGDITARHNNIDKFVIDGTSSTLLGPLGDSGVDVHSLGVTLKTPYDVETFSQRVVMDTVDEHSNSARSLKVTPSQVKMQVHSDKGGTLDLTQELFNLSSEGSGVRTYWDEEKDEMPEEYAKVVAVTYMGEDILNANDGAVRLIRPKDSDWLNGPDPDPLPGLTVFSSELSNTVISHQWWWGESNLGSDRHETVDIIKARDDKLTISWITSEADGVPIIQATPTSLEINHPDSGQMGSTAKIVLDDTGVWISNNDATWLLEAPTHGIFKGGGRRLLDGTELAIFEESADHFAIYGADGDAQYRAFYTEEGTTTISGDGSGVYTSQIVLASDGALTLQSGLKLLNVADTVDSISDLNQSNSIVVSSIENLNTRLDTLSGILITGGGTGGSDLNGDAVAQLALLNDKLAAVELAHDNDLVNYVTLDQLDSAEQRVAALELIHFNDTGYDDSGLSGRIADLEAIDPAPAYDDSGLNTRLETLEAIDHAVTYDDTEIRARVVTVEGSNTLTVAKVNTLEAAITNKVLHNEDVAFVGISQDLSVPDYQEISGWEFVPTTTGKFEVSVNLALYAGSSENETHIGAFRFAIISSHVADTIYKQLPTMHVTKEHLTELKTVYPYVSTQILDLEAGSRVILLGSSLDNGIVQVQKSGDDTDSYDPGAHPLGYYGTSHIVVKELLTDLFIAQGSTPGNEYDDSIIKNDILNLKGVDVGLNSRVTTLEDAVSTGDPAFTSTPNSAQIFLDRSADSKQPLQVTMGDNQFRVSMGTPNPTFEASYGGARISTGGLGGDPSFAQVYLDSQGKITFYQNGGNATTLDSLIAGSGGGGVDLTLPDGRVWQTTETNSPFRSPGSLGGSESVFLGAWSTDSAERASEDVTSTSTGLVVTTDPSWPQSNIQLLVAGVRVLHSSARGLRMDTMNSNGHFQLHFNNMNIATQYGNVLNNYTDTTTLSNTGYTLIEKRAQLVLNEDGSIKFIQRGVDVPLDDLISGSGGGGADGAVYTVTATKAAIEAPVGNGTLELGDGEFTINANTAQPLVHLSNGKLWLTNGGNGASETEDYAAVELGANGEITFVQNYNERTTLTSLINGGGGGGDVDYEHEVGYKWYRHEATNKETFIGNFATDGTALTDTNIANSNMGLYIQDTGSWSTTKLILRGFGEDLIRYYGGTFRLNIPATSASMYLASGLFTLFNGSGYILRNSKSTYGTILGNGQASSTDVQAFVTLSESGKISFTQESDQVTTLDELIAGGGGGDIRGITSGDDEIRIKVDNGTFHSELLLQEGVLSLSLSNTSSIVGAYQDRAWFSNGVSGAYGAVVVEDDGSIEFKHTRNGNVEIVLLQDIVDHMEGSGVDGLTTLPAAGRSFTFDGSLIEPANTEVTNLGSADNRFNNTYSKGVFTKYLIIQEEDNVQSARLYPDSTGGMMFYSSKTDSGMTGDTGAFYPLGHEESSLGIPTKKWKELFAVEVDAEIVSFASNLSISSPSSATMIITTPQYGRVTPAVNGDTYFGSSSKRWRMIYTGGLDNTSDERMKTHIGVKDARMAYGYPEDWLDAWESVNWGRFKMTTWNTELWDGGVIAQDIIEAFGTIGVNVVTETDYVRWDEETDRYSVDYIKLQAIENAYQRRRMDKIEARLDAAGM